MAQKINEQSELTIPLKNLVSLLAVTAISVWAYFTINERLNFLESGQTMMLEEIEENDTWIDNFEPPKQVQDTLIKVRELEIRLTALETKFNLQKK